MSERPLSITIISWVLIVTGCVTFISGLVPRAGDSESAAASAPSTRPRPHTAAEFAFVCTVRAAAAVAGVFMLRRRDWARWLALAWFAFHVVLSGLHDPMKFAIHVVLFVVVAYFLLRPRAWAYFGGAARADQATA